VVDSIYASHKDSNNSLSSSFTPEMLSSSFTPEMCGR
jgi:hypothetical protein